jgi:uncharacterized membrane protein
MEVNSADRFFFSLHFAACAYMTGLIWTVQLILYPAFAYVEPARFKKFHSMHSSRISVLVGPVMLLELVTAIALLCQDLSHWIWKLNLASVLLIWFCTAFVSVPIHNLLADGLQLSNVKKLIRTNWLRTTLWTFRLAMLGFLL